MQTKDQPFFGDEISLGVAKIIEEHKADSAKLRIRKKQKEYREKNREKLSAYFKDPEVKKKMAEHNKEFRRKNREYVNALERKYYYQRQLAKVEKFLKEND